MSEKRLNAEEEAYLREFAYAVAGEHNTLTLDIPPRIRALMLARLAAYEMAYGEGGPRWTPSAEMQREGREFFIDHKFRHF